HRRRRVRLVAQQDPRRDARGLPEGLQDTAPVPYGGRRRGPEGSAQGRLEAVVGIVVRGCSVGIDGIVHGTWPSRFFGPHSWFSARAIFAHDFSGSGEKSSWLTGIRGWSRGTRPAVIRAARGVARTRGRHPRAIRDGGNRSH